MFQKTRFVKLRSWLCVVRHQRLTLSSTVNYEMTSTKKNSELQLAFDLAGCFYHTLETLWWARVPYNNQWWTRFIIRSLQSFYIHILKWNLGLSWSSPLYGAVLRTIDRLTPTWPGFLPTSLPGLCFCSWFLPCSEGIFLDSLVLPSSTKKQHLQIPNRSG